MEQDLFAPASPAMPWVPSIDSEAPSPNTPPKTEILTMAQALNRALRKILTERGVSFQRTKTWKESTDPQFEAKKTAS